MRRAVKSATAVDIANVNISGANKRDANIRIHANLTNEARQYLLLRLIFLFVTFASHMGIVTKTGDTGTTSLFGGKRVLKSDPLVEACGSIDELTSLIGLVCSKAKKEKEILLSIQKDLYQIMAFLAGDRRQDFKNLKKQIKNMEKYIEELEKKLPKLTRFIIPSGSEVSSWFHILRTVCRRAERAVIKYYSSEKLRITNYELRVTEYLNRLSDLFFMMARKYNKEEKLAIG